MYNAIESKDVFNALFVDGDGIGLHTDDAKRSCAAQGELAVCTSSHLVFILIFGRIRCRSSKEYLLIWFVY